MGMTFRGFTSGSDDDSNDESKKKPAALVSEPIRGSTSSANRSQAMVGSGSKITGSLQLSGQAELDCQVEGEIEAPDTLIIGESAQIKARIHGGDIIVRGTVQGDIIASKRITLKRPAKVAGNISAPNLIIEEGVLFEGKCSMVASTSTSSGVTSTGYTTSTEMRGKISTPSSVSVANKVANS
jgi:cytoskeletal protein CcmA (bactofilin family)